MKKILLSLFALNLCIYSLAQDRKFEVICEVYQSHISYAGMNMLLPDSVKGYFLKLGRKSRLSDLFIVNYLCANGWKLVNYGNRRDVSGSNPVYVLNREFLFSDKDYQVVLKRVNDWMKDK